MANIQTNTPTSLAKVAVAAQSAYVSRDLPARSGESRQYQAVTLDIIAVKSNHLLVQERQSGQKLLLDQSALQSSANTSFAKGDSLVLLSMNQKTITFVLEKSVPQSPHSLTAVTLKKVANSLSATWPDIPANTFKQKSPVILSQVNIAINTQQANTLAAAIVSLASATGQPTLKVNTTAESYLVKSTIVQPNAALTRQTPLALSDSRANTLSLMVNTQANNYLRLDIPLNAKLSGNSPALSTSTIAQLKELGSANQKLNIQFDVSSKRTLIVDITSTASPKVQLSASALKDVNQLLLGQFNNMKQVLANLVVTPQSHNLTKGIVLEANTANLQGLGPSMKQHLTRGVSMSALQNANILVSQHQQKAHQIEVSLLAKPTLVKLDNAQLEVFNVKLGAAQQAARSVTSVESLAQSTKSENVYSKNPTAALLDMRHKIDKSSSKLDINVHKNDTLNSASSNASNAPTLAIQGKLTQLLKDQLSAILAAKELDTGAAAGKLSVLQASIYSELNQLLPKAHTMSESLPSLLKQLHLLGKGATGDLKMFLQQLIQQVNEHIPTTDGAEHAAGIDVMDEAQELIFSQSARSIKDMLSASMLPNVSNSAVQALGAIGSQGGLINGLVAMLQASLQAKLLSQQPQLLSALLQSSALAKRMPTAAASNKTNNGQAKLLQDLSTLDPKGNLIGELNKVLSGHSLHKMSGAEASLQQNDSFYYVLPNLFSPQHKDIEIVIKREHSSNNKEQQNQQSWQLSMKLDIGKRGEILAKVKLAGNTLDLNMYASSSTLKETIVNYLPQLNTRLTSLGLLVKPQCFLGKIPDTLHKTNFQAVQTYV